MNNGTSSWIHAIILAIAIPLLMVSNGAALSLDSVKVNLMADLKIDASRVSVSRSTNTLCFMSDEECALINCYKYKIAVRILGDTAFVSALSSFEVIPFADKVRPNDFGKRSMKKIYQKIKSSISKSQMDATIFFDLDKEDRPGDYLVNGFRRVSGYGASLDVVRKLDGEPWIQYHSFWSVFKNGLGNHPLLDTIPAGGIVVVDDFSCGLIEGRRVFDTFWMLPDFVKIRDVDTTAIVRAKVKMVTRPNTGIGCNEYNTYFLAINSEIRDTSRLVFMGERAISHSQQVGDWRIYLQSRDSAISFGSWTKTP